MFTIRQMVELTGLSEFTIRGWEQRYGAFAPRRSESGRRTYDRHDVERALLLRELTQGGHKISRISSLNHRQLSALFAKTSASRLDQSGAPNTAPLVAKAMSLLALQKWVELSLLIRDVDTSDAPAAIEGFFLPLLRLLADSVAAQTTSVSQEHVLSSLLKEKLFAALAQKPAPDSGPDDARFVLAAPEGDHHEIGLLMAHLLIRHFTISSLYLGPHTPAADLAETALRFHASHVLIVANAGTGDGARRDALAFVNDVHKRLGPRVDLLVAGSQAPRAGQATGLRVINTFQDLTTLLSSLRSSHA